MDFKTYRAAPAINFSTLKAMAESPLHYQHALKTPREDTDALMMGRAVHCATLEPDRFPLDFTIWDGGVRRGKAWDAFCEANADRTILRADEYAMCLAIRDAVRRHPIAKQYLARGQAEHSIFWRDEETGLDCKARLDWVSESLPGFCDLKTTTTTEVRQFAAQVARYLWHGQLAFYRNGLRAKGLDLPPMILAVEKSPPHDCVVYELEEDSLWCGEELVKGLLRRVAECTETGIWPGRYDGSQSLALPTWAFDAAGLTTPEDEDDPTMGLVVNQ